MRGPVPFLLLTLVGIPASAAERGEALFAGGCFWCEEATFEGLPGVEQVISGFTGGTAKDPTYEQVSAGGTGHAEAVRVVFDPSKISYRQLLEVYWHNVDPVDGGGQFCDRGDQYRPAIYWLDEAQHKAIETSMKAVEKQLKHKLAVEIRKAGPFYAAEAYHQDFFKTHAERYHEYRNGCGRDRRLMELWGQPGRGH
jgi:peptide-methionine (S)-S-oxide reductase